MHGADLYRVLLWCYPAPFRREYGQEMLCAFDAELSDARRAGHGVAIWASAATWARALRDLVPTAFREHRPAQSFAGVRKSPQDARPPSAAARFRG